MECGKPRSTLLSVTKNMVASLKKKNEQLQKLIASARALADDIAKESDNLDPMEYVYLGLAAEIIDQRLAFHRRQEETKTVPET